MSIFAGNPDSRTTIGGKAGGKYAVNWNASGEALMIINELSVDASGVEGKKNKLTTDTSYTLTPTDGSGGATFLATIPAYTGTDALRYIAISPASAQYSEIYLGASNPTDNDVNVINPKKQTPTATSVQSNAIIAIGSVLDEPAQPTSLNFGVFKHITAYGRMVIKGVGTDVIKSVRFSSSVYVAGSYYYYYNNTTANRSAGNSASSKTITITAPSGTTNEGAIWFSCIPQTLDNFIVDVETFYRKEIPASLSTTLKFTAGTVTEFTVNVEAVVASTKNYVKVTDVSTLKVGDKVLLMNTENSKAMSSTQNTNNRGEYEVTIVADKIAEIPTLHYFTLGIDVTNFTFNDATGYLYAASSTANNLKSQTTLNDNGKWAVTISGGSRTIVAQGINTRNHMRYNKTNSLFSSYASTSTIVDLIDIYVLEN